MVRNSLGAYLSLGGLGFPGRSTARWKRNQASANRQSLQFSVILKIPTEGVSKFDVSAFS
jgi:hypothetical protein